MCDRDCECKTCVYSFIIQCGECCGNDSFEQCRNGGVHNCMGYYKCTFWKRLWFTLKRRR